MANTDDILWHMLAVIGLNFVNCKLGVIAKYFRIFFAAGFTMSLLYFTTVNFCYIRKQRYKESIIFLVICLQSGIMWYFAYFRKKEISNVVLQIYHQRGLKNVSNETKYCIIISITVILFVVPCFICILGQIMLDYKTAELTYWACGYELSSEVWSRVFIFCGQFAYVGFGSGFPIYLMLCISLLFYRCSEVLHSYNTLLKIELHTRARDRMKCLADFFHIVKLLQKLNKAFKHLTFFIILYNLDGIFFILVIVSLQEVFKFYITYTIFVAYYGICNIVVIMCFTICCSMIPEKLLEIKATVTDYIDSCSNTDLISKRNMFYLKRIESKEVVYISVCGMFHVTRNFILSALGLILTYGLLIINMKF